MNTIIKADRITKIFRSGDNKLLALNNVSLEVKEGEIVAIVGPSGCGKTTLVNVVGQILKQDSGQIYLNDSDVSQLSDNEMATIRNSFFGYLTQDFSLIEGDSVFDNIRIPLIYSSNSPSKKEQRKLVEKYLAQLNLNDIIDKPVNKLSGGQRQRVALIRSIINNPRVVIADEPTGSLDSATSLEIFNLLAGLISEGISVLMVTHNLAPADRCTRKINMLDGRIIDD